MELTFTVTEKYNKKPAKLFLRDYCDVSARTLVQLKNTELGITRNGSLLKVIDPVYTGDYVVLKFPEDENEIIPVKMPLNILYEDKHILVLNKPAFMPVHPTRDHQADTLANGVAFYMRQKNEFYSFRALNRLDRDTTGIVLLAKNVYSANKLRNCVEKNYYAVCEGEILNNGRIEAPISLKEGHTIQREVSPLGAKSITNYEVIKHGNMHTLLKFKLETGRTHQIRVHMSHLGHPLAGDDMYGGSLNYINRQALHCASCVFIHPVLGEKIKIFSEIPNEMKNILRDNYSQPLENHI